MPAIWMDVDVALAEVPVNLVALIDDSNFKSREESVTYDQAGMDLVWNFVTTGGAYTQTVVTPTTSGVHDWVNQGNGMYSIEIPASGGTIDNDTTGFGWFTGFATGILPWTGPVIIFRAAGINDKLCDWLYSQARGLAGTALPNANADAAYGLPTSDAGGLDMDTLLARLDAAISSRSTHNAAAVKTAIEANGSKIDHIWETTEDNAGTRRFSAAGLAQAPDVALTTAGQQDIAQIIKGTAGVVYYVKSSGGSDGNGLSPDDAYLHTTTSVKTVIEAASANDVVILGPGTFDISTNGITIPNGVQVICSGIDVTIITGSGSATTTVALGSNSLLQDVTVKATDVVGYPVGGTAAFTNASVVRVKGSGIADGFRVSTNGQMTATLWDCIWESELDGFAIRAVTAGSVFELINNQIRCSSSTEGVQGISLVAGTIRAWNTSILATTTNGLAIGVSVPNAGSVVELFGGGIRAVGTTTVFDLSQGSGASLVAVGVDYDRSKTSGTITEVSSAESALVAKNLDHLMKTAVNSNSDMTTEVADGTVLSNIMSAGSDTSTFVVADDSLQGISEGAAGGGATAAQVWAYAIPASPSANTAADYLQLMDAVLGGVTNTETANQVAFKNRSGVEVRRVTFGSSDGSRTASTIS